jgi:hypothetical protein
MTTHALGLGDQCRPRLDEALQRLLPIGAIIRWLQCRNTLVVEK